MVAERCLLLLLCGAVLGRAVHLDFAEHRSQAAKIKVNPRGNLWATGHFMGKKSVPGTPRMDELRQPVAPMSFGPSLRALLEDVVELLTRELLKILLQERLLDQNQRKYDLADQRKVKRDTALYVQEEESVLQKGDWAFNKGAGEIFLKLKKRSSEG